MTTTDIFASTPIFCVLRMLLVLALCNNWICLTGDISTAFLHAAAATADLFMYPPAEFYNAFDQIVWRLNKAILWLTQQPKSMAKSPGWGDATTWTTTTCQRAQRLRNTTGRCIHTMLRRRLALHRTTGDGPTSCSRASSNTSYSVRQENSTVGNTISFLGRNFCNKGDYYEISLADSYTTELLEEANMLNCNPAPAPGTNTLKASSEMEQELSKEEHAAYRRMVGKLQWMTYTRPDIGFATKELARALDTANNSSPAEIETLTQVHQGNTTLQTIRETYNQDTNSWSSTRHPSLCRQRLGRMRNYEEVNNRISNQSLRRNNPLRKQNTGNNCAEQRRSRTLCDQHRSNRSLTHQQPPERSSQHEENQFNIRIHTDSSSGKEHGNKDWIIKEGQAHRAQTPVYTTAGRTWPREDCQDQHRSQPGRHLHQVCRDRDAFASHQWCWHQHPASLNNKQQRATTTTVSLQPGVLMCERVHNVRTSCVACTHKHTYFWAMVSTKVDNMNYPIVIPYTSTWSIWTRYSYSVSTWSTMSYTSSTWCALHDCGRVWQHVCFRQHDGLRTQCFNSFWIQHVFVSQTFFWWCQHFVDNRWCSPQLCLINSLVNNNVSKANSFEMATKFVTPEVTNMTHVATGVEHYTSVYNLVDMKEFGNIFKVNTVGQALTTDEAFQQINQRAEAGIQHLFVWFTQEDYNKYVNNGNMTMIPGDNMMPKWSHWICTTTVHDCLTTSGVISSHSCTPQLPTWRWSTWSFLNWIQSMQVMQHDMASAAGSTDLGVLPNCKSRRNTGSATRSWWTNIISPCMDRWQRSSTDTAGRKDLDGHTTSWSTSMKPSARRAQHTGHTMLCAKSWSMVEHSSWFRSTRHWPTSFSTTLRSSTSASSPTRTWPQIASEDQQHSLVDSLIEWFNRSSLRPTSWINRKPWKLKLQQMWSLATRWLPTTTPRPTRWIEEKGRLPWLNSLKQQRCWWVQQAVQLLRVPTNRLYTNTLRQQSFVNTLVL